MDSEAIDASVLWVAVVGLDFDFDDLVWLELFAVLYRKILEAWVAFLGGEVIFAEKHWIFVHLGCKALKF